MATRFPAGPYWNTDKGRAILAATAVCGTLDILSAFVFGALKDVSPARILRYVASGPFGEAMRDGGAGAAMLGLATHFGLMAIMISVFVAATIRSSLARRVWLITGTSYGLVLYAVMYWIVLPARFGTMPSTEFWPLARTLFSHVICVGIPMAWIVHRRPDRTEGLGSEDGFTPQLKGS